MTNTINLGPGAALYKHKQDALDNNPGGSYALTQTGSGWWLWQHQLMNPFQILLDRIEKLEERVCLLEEDV